MTVKGLLASKDQIHCAGGSGSNMASGNSTAEVDEPTGKLTTAEANARATLAETFRVLKGAMLPLDRLLREEPGDLLASVAGRMAGAVTAQPAACAKVPDGRASKQSRPNGTGSVPSVEAGAQAASSKRRPTTSKKRKMADDSCSEPKTPPAAARVDSSLCAPSGGEVNDTAVSAKRRRHARKVLEL